MISRGDSWQTLCLASLGVAIISGGAWLGAHEMEMAEVREELTARGGNAQAALGPSVTRGLVMPDALDGELAGRLLDIVLYRESSAMQASNKPRAEIQPWIDALAVAIVSRAPLNGKAWCILAISEMRRNGVVPVAIERLRTCYRFAPFEAAITGWRLSLALASWDELPADLQISAMAEVALHLRTPSLRPRILQQLAFATAALAPEREALASSLVGLHGGEVKKQFDQALSQTRLRLAPHRVSH
jgi:hypothetical protein